jgi:histone-lysine N-methyltransferase SETMAR
MAITAIGKAGFDKIVNHLRYSKLCARWVLRSRTEEHKEQKKIICLEFLPRYEAEGDNFLSTMVMGDETWIHYFQPETKRQSMERHHMTSPWKKNLKAITSVSKIMATVVWNREGVILTDVWPRGQTNNLDVYVENLNKLKKSFQRVCSRKDATKVLHHHNNARPHTSLHTSYTIAKLQ